MWLTFTVVTLSTSEMFAPAPDPVVVANAMRSAMALMLSSPNLAKDPARAVREVNDAVNQHFYTPRLRNPTVVRNDWTTGGMPKVTRVQKLPQLHDHDQEIREYEQILGSMKEDKAPTEQIAVIEGLLKDARAKKAKAK